MTDPITTEERAELRRKAEAATPGPWAAVEGASGGWWVERPNTATIAEIDIDYSGHPGADAALIAAANPATVLRLLDALERLEQWKAETLPVLAGLQELGKALDLPLGTQITGPQAMEAVERLRRGARTLGGVVEQNGRMILDITGLHDWIDEDGDGDWGAVWESAYELLPRARAAEGELADLRQRIEALVRSPQADQFRDEACHGVVGLPYANNRYVRLLDDLRALLLDAPEAGEGGASDD